jgi:hypothetical protein
LKVGRSPAETLRIPRQNIEKAPRNLQEFLWLQTIKAAEVGNARNASGRGKVSVPFLRLHRCFGFLQHRKDQLKLVPAKLIDSGSIAAPEQRFELTGEVPPLLAEGFLEKWVVGDVAREHLVHGTDGEVQGVEVVKRKRKRLSSDRQIAENRSKASRIPRGHPRIRNKKSGWRNARDRPPGADKHVSLQRSLMRLFPRSASSACSCIHCTPF